MSLGRQTFKHAAIYSIANVLGGLASFLLLPFYAHHFGTEGYGVMALIDTSLGMFTVLLSGGLSMAIIRIYHEEEDPSRKSLSIGTGIWLVWCLGFLLAVVPIVFSQLLSEFLFGTGQYYSLIVLALVTFVIDVAGQSASAAQIIKQQSVLFSSIGLGRLIIGLSLNIWLVVILQVGLIGFFLSSLVTAVLNSIIFHFMAIKEHGFGFDWRIAEKLVKFQLPLVPGEVIGFVGRQADRVQVRALVGLEGVGILEMAYKFPPLLNLFINIPFRRAWNTKSIEIAEQVGAAEIIASMFTRFLYLNMFAGLLLALTIQDILKVMTPPEFWPAGRIAQIEIVTTILTACSMYLSFGILYRKQTKILSAVRIVLVPIKLLLGWLFIVRWGLAGAALSAMIIELTSLGWIAIKGHSFYPLPLEYAKIGAIVLYAAFLFILLNGATYEAVIPIADKIMSGFVQFMQLVPIEGGGPGRIIELLQERREHVISFVLNCFFSLFFLALFPLVSGTRPIFKENQNVDAVKL
jgi:O-antigen/teichoic acid export membrane protein